MTAITYDGATPTVGASADTWGTTLNVSALAKIKVDLDMLNASPTARILGRTTTGTGEVERLTATQATAILNAVVGDAGSGGTKGLVPAPAAGDAAAKKVLRADGTWASGVRASGVFTGSTGAAVVSDNVTCSRFATGIYTFTFTTALANANYVLIVTPEIPFSADGIYAPNINVKTASGFEITTTKNFGGSIGAYDPTQITVLVI